VTIASGDKPVRLSGHASGYSQRRGFTESEVVETIRTSVWLPARSNRLEAAKDYPFDREWNGRYYATKRIRAIFVEEADEIVVVTVYTYFFS
jgi:hypothetical protein